MPESKEERKAYLRGAVDALETLAQHWTAGKGMNIASRLADARRDLAALDIPQLSEHYGSDRVGIPAPWEWDETFGTTSSVWLDCRGVPREMPLHSDCLPRLGLRKRNPKVWFEAEDKSRLPKKGECYWHEIDERWATADEDFHTLTNLCAVRHEEYDDAPQVITQADVDRVMRGGVK